MLGHVENGRPITWASGADGGTQGVDLGVEPRHHLGKAAVKIGALLREVQQGPEFRPNIVIDAIVHPAGLAEHAGNSPPTAVGQGRGGLAGQLPLHLFQVFQLGREVMMGRGVERPQPLAFAGGELLE